MVDRETLGLRVFAVGAFCCVRISHVGSLGRFGPQAFRDRAYDAVGNVGLHRLNEVVPQGLQTLGRNLVAGPQRRDADAEKAVRAVDVSRPGGDRLVENQLAHRRPPPPNRLDEALAVSGLVANWVGAELGDGGPHARPVEDLASRGAREIGRKPIGGEPQPHRAARADVDRVVVAAADAGADDRVRAFTREMPPAVQAQMNVKPHGPVVAQGRAAQGSLGKGRRAWGHRISRV